LAGTVKEKLADYRSVKAERCLSIAIEILSQMHKAAKKSLTQSRGDAGENSDKFADHC
jgi:hypothetical protein